ncbi:hypothetical protein GCM10010112_07340 [Actinoplanes lobatus]|uniref:Uncharacterized protein n=1 Tax=Actinoplanes lobatus TaxID=113568 RepID=A0A7W7MEC1_9ACTN|nr:hypothetical protein [Actinoplanes lobatus]MBB4747154.1 hypothetical protein [Actinoplanes lobatus]GGN55964.1 hypothetical protein GCM10010112_07340 [Actinoplanes lobatus]GIE39278.1 hypothetical protein Alo02nite_21760 [Actinoplanes lobatus]
MTRRHYPPMMTFHSPECPALAGLLDQFESMPVDRAREKYPNHHFDLCAAVDITPYVAVELAVPEHLYDPSGTRPDDAVRSLCRKCFGTHGEDEGREVINVRPQQEPPSGLVIPGA